MGTSTQTLLHWDQDAPDDCSPNDQVWGWGILLTEILHHDKDMIGDDVLHKMLHTGLPDKKAGVPA